MQSSSTYPRVLTHGTYLITVRDPNGTVIHTENRHVPKSSSCDHYNLGANLVTGGEFDSFHDAPYELDPMFSFPNSRMEIHWDGYIKESVRLFDRSGDGNNLGLIDIDGKVIETGSYVIQEFV